MSELTVRPVPGIGEVTAGDDLAALIADAAPWLADGDVLVVTSKVVSKAEGRLVPVPAEDGPERTEARDRALRAETAKIVAQRGQTRIVQTHHGLVMAAAGIDASNVDRGHLVLLPLDPDASAESLRKALRERTGKDVAVIVSDTMGRPWRLGLTDVAIGAAGIGALRDHRGESDPHGNELLITQVAVVDELAAAADLVKGKTDGVPVAVVRGYTAATVGLGARALVRSASEDLFSMGTAEALRSVATLPDAMEFADGVLPEGAVDRAVALVGLPVRHGIIDPQMRLPASTQVLLVPEADASARAGADVHRLRAALAAEGLATAWLDGPGLGLIAVGVAR